MSHIARPALSVIVRRFHQEHSDDIERAIEDIQRSAADQSGFIDLQNSFTPKKNGCELVTVVTFDTPENLERWESSAVRKRLAKELDRLSHESSTRTRFLDVSLLAAPTARVSKMETVAILIGWILLLGSALSYPMDMVWPQDTAPFWRNAFQVLIIVTLISYLLLPVSSIVLTRLKARLLKSRL